MMIKTPVIMDCDPGADDFLAILLALASPELEVLGITTVFGNASAEQTAWNAARACRMAKAEDLLVYAGAEAPLGSKVALDFSYCGRDGLCDSPLPGDSTFVSDKRADIFFAEALAAAEEPVTIVSTAAMTNVAELIRQRPELTSKIKEIVTISGYYSQNPRAARAEWNILVDAAAAETVFSSPVAVRAVGLDVTAELQDRYVDRLLASARGGISDFIRHTTDYNVRHQLYPRSILVDSMAVAAVIHPEIARYQAGAVQIDPEKTDRELMQFEPECRKGAPVYAADRFDYEAYIRLLEERVMARYETVNLH